jgi:hypothetical protein
MAVTSLYAEEASLAKSGAKAASQLEKRWSKAREKA